MVEEKELRRSLKINGPALLKRHTPSLGLHVVTVIRSDKKLRDFCGKSVPYQMAYRTRSTLVT